MVSAGRPAPRRCNDGPSFLRFCATVVVLSFFFVSISALNEDVIEDVNKAGLEKLLEEHDFVAVLFCKCNVLTVCNVFVKIFFENPLQNYLTLKYST